MTGVGVVSYDACIMIFSFSNRCYWGISFPALGSGDLLDSSGGGHDDANSSRMLFDFVSLEDSAPAQ